MILCGRCCVALEAVDGGGEHGEVVAALPREQLGVQETPHLAGRRMVDGPFKFQATALLTMKNSGCEPYVG